MAFAPIKKLVKQTLQSFGVDIIRHNVYTSEDILLKTIMKRYEIKTVIDIGANEGQYASGLIDNDFRGDIYSFEPIASVFKALSVAASHHSQWHTFHLGMGSKEEEVTMNISENLVSSSILKVAKASLDAQPQTRIMREETIQISTLDIFIGSKPELGENIWLKLDVQGYELEALKGGLKNIQRYKFIQVELSFVPVYEGGPLFNDVTSFIEDQGFEIFTLIPGFRDAVTGRLLQADGIFIRKDSSSPS